MHLFQGPYTLLSYFGETRGRKLTCVLHVYDTQFSTVAVLPPCGTAVEPMDEHLVAAQNLVRAHKMAVKLEATVVFWEAPDSRMAKLRVGAVAKAVGA